MVRQVVGNIDLEAGTLTLDDGRVFTVDDIPGNSWNANRLGKLTEAIQTLADLVIPLADLPSDDPDKTATPAELFSEYGNRVFLDGQGNIIHRNVIITFSWDGTTLIPAVRRVT